MPDPKAQGLTEDETPADPPGAASVTVQPSISTEEAAETDVELSPVGDEQVEVGSVPEEETEPTSVPVDPADVEVRSAARREIDVRLLPWNTTIETRQGPEEFARGATLGTADDGVMLMGLEHEAHMGLGQDGRPVLTRRPAGRSMKVWEDDSGPHVRFKVARTQAGDELLALAEDRIVRGVSVEFTEVPGGTAIVKRGGRRVRVHQRVALTGASMTYRPAYGEQAAVLAVRSQQEEATMAEEQVAPAEGAVDSHALIEFMAQQRTDSQAFATRMLERLESLEERARSQEINFPGGGTSDAPVLTMGEWASIALKGLAGDRLTNEQIKQVEQVRSLDDVVTSDNLGVVPEAHLTEIRGIIDTSRPFLATTRRLPTPPAGVTINVPVITQRPTTAVQSAEKQEVDSTKTIITSEAFDMVTIAGAGDLSIQVIKRSSPSFLALWLELLAEALAFDAEDQALRALFNATGGGITSADPLDPDNLLLGDAYQTSFNAIRRPPDTLWLSTEAIGGFIDAKATGTNAPLYPGVTASATAAGGITGNISGLRVVHVPALDAHGSFAIVGPSSGFAWCEDGAYELQADVPSKAGRDVGIVSMMFFIPWYPAAFTLYNVAS
jgi:phage head maturation protease